MLVVKFLKILNTFLWGVLQSHEAGDEAPSLDLNSPEISDTLKAT